MNGDLLLAWLSHVREGSWSGFRRAVSELDPNAANSQRLIRHLRVGLSDLGYADFFVNQSQRWRILPPSVAGLAERYSGAVLCGARTPNLVLQLKSGVSDYGLDLQITESIDFPSRILITGPWPSIEACGRQLGLHCFPHAGWELLSSTQLISDSLEHTQAEQAPLNWDVLSFDLDKLEWVPSLLPQTACEFIPNYGPSKFCFHKRHGRVFPMPKRDAVYLSAMIHAKKLIVYDPERNRLSVPIAAPLPERLSRAACLCSGTLPTLSGSRLEYTDILFEIASALLVASGQSHSITQELTQSERASVG